MSRVRAPRIARWIVTRRLPIECREHALGDLQEELERRWAEEPAAARAWYRRQALRAVVTRRAPPRDRDARRPRLGATIEDIRFASRALRATPAVTLLAVVTFGLGIGANATMYTLLQQLVLRPLPLADADRLLVVREGNADGRPGRWNLSFPVYEELRAEIAALETVAAWQQDGLGLATAESPTATRVPVTAATAELLPMLGATVFLGRGIGPEDDAREAGEPVAVLSHALWAEMFARDPDVIGRTIRVDDEPHTVIGVVEAGFRDAIGSQVLPEAPTAIWVPYRNSYAAEGMHLRGLHNVSVTAKLAAGVTLEQARAEVDGFTAAMLEAYPDDNDAIFLDPAQELAVAPMRRPLGLLFGSVCLVLLIACANVANLLLGKAVRRRREIAVRAALGAGRIRLLRQLMVESLALSGLGGLLGGIGATLALRAIARAGLVADPRFSGAGPDLTITLFVAGVSLLGAIVFGLMPALRATGGNLGGALRASDRGAGPSADRLRRGLAVAEMALAIVLLVGAGLMIRSFAAATQVDPGFDATRVLTARLQLPIDFAGPEWPRSVAFFRDLQERLAARADVESVAAGYWLPVDSGWNNGLRFADRAEPEPGADAPHARFRPVSPGYFETARIPVLAGRTFTAADDTTAPGVVVVNESFVRTYFEEGDEVLGTRLDYGNWWGAGPNGYEIVGIVRDVLFSGRTRASYPTTYFPHAQQPVREMSLMIRTRGEPLALAPVLRAEVAALEPTLPVDQVATLASRLAGTETNRRSMLVMLGSFAALALLLAAIGVYGVMAAQVGQRTRELGIRKALGAGRGRIRAMVLRDALMLTAAGTILGLAGARALSGFIESQLYGIEPTDGWSFIGAAAFLALVAIIATWIPARRATRVDAIVSLRAD